jgi:hypothetical protein
MKIEHGRFLKDDGVTSVKVDFTAPFQDVPNVVLTSHWNGQHAEVGHVETIDEITTSHFKVVSGNGADNYYVQWIAVAEK